MLQLPAPISSLDDCIYEDYAAMSLNYITSQAVNAYFAIATSCCILLKSGTKFCVSTNQPDTFRHPRWLLYHDAIMKKGYKHCLYKTVIEQVE